MACCFKFRGISFSALIIGCLIFPSNLLAESERLVIEKIIAPDQVVTAQSFSVVVGVRERIGVKKVEIFFDGRSYVLPTEGNLGKVLTVQVASGDKPGIKKLEVLASGMDGIKGPPRSLPILVINAFRNKLSDRMDPKIFLAGKDKWQKSGLTPQWRYKRNSLYKKSKLSLRQLDQWPNLNAQEKWDAPARMNSWWKAFMANGGPQPFDFRTHCGPSVTGFTSRGEVLRCWLDLNPGIKSKLTWEFSELTDEISSSEFPPFDISSFLQRPYSEWTEEMKTELDFTFFAYWNWLKSGTKSTMAQPPDPPVNQIPANSPNAYFTFLNPRQAWVMYLGSIAHNLALEIGGFVPWSVLSYSAEDQKHLFSSSAMMRRVDKSWNIQYTDSEGKTVTFTGYTLLGLTHALPTKVFKFFVEKDLIRSTHYNTIARLLKWGRENMVHAGCFEGSIPEGPDLYYALWQYYGGPPVSRMLEGTPNQCQGNQVASWTRGCNGTSSFFSSTLRSLNIPAHPLYGNNQDPINLCMNTTPVFPTIGQTLSHGDDVYGMRSNFPTLDPSVIPAREVFISWDTLMDWFGGKPDYIACPNVGRQVSEVALKYLPNWIMNTYCSVLGQALFMIEPCRHPAMASFYNIHSCQELQDMSLLGKLKEKDEKLGYCPNH